MNSLLQNDNMSYFGDRFKELLEEKQILQQDLAFDLRMDPGLISKLISGKRAPKDRLLKKIVAYEPLGLSMTTLRAWRLLDDYTLEELLLVIKEQVAKCPEIKDEIRRELEE